MYLVNTKAYIFYAMNVLSHFMCEPKNIHLMVFKHILRYLWGTIGLGLKNTYTMLQLQGYLNWDWEGNYINHKSNIGFCYSLIGSAMISSFSIK